MACKAGGYLVTGTMVNLRDHCTAWMAKAVELMKDPDLKDDSFVLESPDQFTTEGFLPIAGRYFKASPLPPAPSKGKWHSVN